MTPRVFLAAAWDALVADLARAPSTWNESTVVARLAQTIEHAAGGNVLVQVRPGQDVGARPSVLRAWVAGELAVVTLRWVPPNLNRAHGYRLKLANDVRWLASLVGRSEARQALAAFVDLQGVIRPETVAALAAAFPSVVLRGFAIRSGAIAAEAPVCPD